VAKVIFGQGNGWFIKTKLTLLLLVMIMPIAGWGWGSGDTSSLAGQWVPSEASSAPRGFPDKIELLKDGTGLGDGQGLKWSAENSRLIFRFDSGQGLAYAYQIANSALVLTNDEGESIKYITPEAKRKAAEETVREEAQRFETDKSRVLGLWEVEAEFLKAINWDGWHVFVECSEKSIDMHFIGIELGKWQPKSSNEKKDILWISRGSDLYLKVDGKEFENFPVKEFPVQFLDDKTVRLDIGKLDSNMPRTVTLRRSSPAELAAAPEAMRKAAEPVRKAAEEAAKAAGFIALAPDDMTWDDAKAYCASKGGRLPLIDGKKILSFSSNTAAFGIPKGTPIDGFDSVGANCPSGLSRSWMHYWTGTEMSNFPDEGYTVWTVPCTDGEQVSLGGGNRVVSYSVVCVP